MNLGGASSVNAPLPQAGDLFGYFDGTRYRFEDPLKLYRALIYHPLVIFELAPAVDEGKEPEKMHCGNSSTPEL